MKFTIALIVAASLSVTNAVKLTSQLATQSAWLAQHQHSSTQQLAESKDWADYLIQKIFLGHRSLAQQDSGYQLSCEVIQDILSQLLEEKDEEVSTAFIGQFDEDEWTEAGNNVCQIPQDDQWTFIFCWADAQSLEDLNGCIQEVDYDSEEADEEEDDQDSEEADEEEDDTDVDYDSEEADEEEDDYDSEEADEEEDDYDSEEADEEEDDQDVDYDSEEADEEDDDYNQEICALRLSYIGEAYSTVDEGVRQDFESQIGPDQWHAFGEALCELDEATLNLVAECIAFSASVEDLSNCL